MLTCVRLPHESGQVPLKLLSDKAMELSCSKTTNMSYKGKCMCQNWIVRGASLKLSLTGRGIDVYSCNALQPCLVYDMYGKSVYKTSCDRYCTAHG